LDLSIGIELPFFRVLVNIEPGSSLITVHYHELFENVKSSFVLISVHFKLNLHVQFNFYSLLGLFIHLYLSMLYVFVMIVYLISVRSGLHLYFNSEIYLFVLGLICIFNYALLVSRFIYSLITGPFFFCYDCLFNFYSFWASFIL